MNRSFAAIALFAFGTPAMAHHSGSMFDQARTVSLVGTVKEFQYTNPHSWLIVSVSAADGQLTDWSFEAEGPSTLGRAGIKAKTFLPGDKITITGNPMKDGRPGALLQSATKADGHVYSPHPNGQQPGAPIPAPAAP